MWKKQERLLAEVVVRADEESTGGAVGEETKQGPLRGATAVETTLRERTPKEVTKEDVAENEVQAGEVL